MEATYVAHLAVVYKVVCLRFLQHLEIVVDALDPITIHYDSTTTLVYAKDPKYHGKTKHIDIRHQYIKDMVTQKDVVMKHISMSHMIANP